MRTRRLAIATALFAIAQASGAVGIVVPGALAQRGGLVAVLSLYMGADACTVQFSKSSEGRNGNDTAKGQVIPCPGGIVVTQIVDRQDVDRTVAASEDPDSVQSASTANAGAVEVRTVELSGDASVVEAALRQETSDLHRQAVEASGSAALGFMAPDALGKFFPKSSVPAASTLAAGCVDGNTNQVRRAGIAWNHNAIGVTVRANVFYKRVSCANWKISEIEAKLLGTNYPLKIWLKDFEYTKVWSAAQSRYLHGIVDLNCPRVVEGDWTRVKPGTLIQANGSLQMESIDTNPNSQSTQVSCHWEAGTSATPLWIYLEGGTR